MILAFPSQGGHGDCLRADGTVCPACLPVGLHPQNGCSEYVYLITKHDVVRSAGESLSDALAAGAYLYEEWRTGYRVPKDRPFRYLHSLKLPVTRDEKRRYLP